MFRNNLPQLNGQTFLTDAGLETWLIFKNGTELREFASFETVRSDAGRQALADYFKPFIALGEERDMGVILESPTWRASPEWGARLGYSASDIVEINREAIALLSDLRANANASVPVVVSGNIGPRGDGYVPGETMTMEEAEAYHAVQIGAFATSNADMVSAITMTNPNEAIGIARAAAKAGLPCVIGFTVETDGRLPDGTPLGEAIESVDAACDTPPVYYMVNCAHPDHFSDKLRGNDDWLSRIHSVRANASRLSHAELDEAEELDEGDARELAGLYVELKELLPNLNVVGGCCGTDHRHVQEITAAIA
ncbi:MULTISPECIES: homocysteine S-methyltransferase family protein [unclassified Ruegeria]|uniref:homocysteine S-methyltransferase family protein n=1 Tax=unclassified Ruegeria TaxID=2625375 RepID=UPI0014926946|nr:MULTISPECIES: homocysteine S-methyltransferase family protein [unclassified Ruegeria]NOD78483.1 homocysteine S-methyltransferase [Ruegeria sp. HKCCD4332]UUV08602.1 homocysteine S-methyltransferase family protein [Ruegeria sp. YS9]